MLKSLQHSCSLYTRTHNIHTLPTIAVLRTIHHPPGWYLVDVGPMVVPFYSFRVTDWLQSVITHANTMNCVVD